MRSGMLDFESPEVSEFEARTDRLARQSARRSAREEIRTTHSRVTLPEARRRRQSAADELESARAIVVDLKNQLIRAELKLERAEDRDVQAADLVGFMERVENPGIRHLSASGG